MKVEGFRSFGKSFDIEFADGLSVLVGENGAGKSAVIDAIRTILQEDEYGRAGLRDTDFHRPFEAQAQASPSISISALFAGLSDEEQIAFLPWTDARDKATLNLRVENKLSARDRFKRLVWGGASSASVFEWELMEAINCIYLPPLRDAEAKLREGRGSRLARLLKNSCRSELERAQKEGETHPLEQKVREFNENLAGDADGPIAAANQLIKARLHEAVGKVFGQDTKISFSEGTFDRLAESLRLLFFPQIDSSTPAEAFRSLEENSLGYNNLLYLATVLAELSPAPGCGPEYLRILLIEEPEAHLHPQLQTRLLGFLQEKAREERLQVIVTTHSPVLAAAAPIDSLIHMSCRGVAPTALRLSSCGLTEQSSHFLSRWLDATKSTLLFAKGVILVEGIAEALLVPELAKRVMGDLRREGKAGVPDSLADAGISVINMNGIYFKHFMQLFCDLKGSGSLSIPVRCAGVTDKDPSKRSKPTRARSLRGNNPALKLIPQARQSDTCRLYCCELKTFEYDLAMEEDNLGVMLSTLKTLCERSANGTASAAEKDWAAESDDAKAKEAHSLLGRISASNIGKGYYAQALAGRLEDDPELPFAVPTYIRDAVCWVLGEQLE
ncbi:MAG TPA: AAA family ATPase [Armatimonadota bacterium]|jgi:predicted ATP-dependent endonuclease of OLD family